MDVDQWSREPGARSIRSQDACQERWVNVAAGQHGDRRLSLRQLSGAEQTGGYRGCSARLSDQPGLRGEQPDRGADLVLGHRDDIGHELADMLER